jgi:hypothetical protein
MNLDTGADRRGIRKDSMNSFFGTKRKAGAIAPRSSFRGVSLLLLLALTVMVGGRFFLGMYASAKPALSVGDWYHRNEQRWRAELSAYQTQFDYVFRETSGAGARLDLEMDD